MDQVNPRLIALDRWISSLRWYDKLPLTLSLALVLALPIALMNLADRYAASQGSAPSSAPKFYTKFPTKFRTTFSRRAVIQDGSFLVPYLIHTTEVSVVACKNVGRSPETARAVALSRAVELANEYGVIRVPSLVIDSVQEQIRRYYDLAEPVTLDPLEVYSCEVQ
jgi:hypothetical protein